MKARKICFVDTDQRKIAKREADRPSTPEEVVTLAEYRGIERHMTWFGDEGARFRATGEPAGQLGSERVRLMPPQMTAGDDGMGGFELFERRHGTGAAGQ